MNPKALMTAAAEARPMTMPPKAFVPPKKPSADLAYLLA